MSLSEYFKKHSGRILFASTVAVSGVGAYTGLYIVHENSAAAATPSVMTTPSVHPALSALTIAQHNDDTIQGKVTEEFYLKKAGTDPKRKAAIDGFNRAIERMEQDGDEMKTVQEDIERVKSRASGLTRDTNVADILKEREARLVGLDSARQEAGVKFVNDLRLSAHLTESDYEELVAAFDKKAAVTLPETLKNYREGAMYFHECRVASGFAAVRSMDENDVAEASNVGACMKDIFDNPQKAHQEREKPPVPVKDKSYGLDEVAGALSGAAIGSALMLPLWLRRRRPGI